MLATALRLFERRGYDATTVEDIARAAEVSHMTFFRHFPCKESVLIGDPFDPLIARSVAAQDRGLSEMARIVRGLLVALETIDAQVDDTIRRRIRVASAVPSLRASMIEGNRATEQAIVEALVEDGADAFAAQVAAAACLAAITTALWHWAAVGPGASKLADTVQKALAVLSPRASVETV